MSTFLYCPACGAEVNPIANKCAYCDSNAEPMETLHDLEYYQNKSQELHGNIFHAMIILLNEEVKNNGIFTQEKYEMRMDNQYLNSIEISNRVKSVRANIPKCPTCQSQNIRKLTAAKRITHGLAFGLFSKTARSQWVCDNCGNKW